MSSHPARLNARRAILSVLSSALLLSALESAAPAARAEIDQTAVQLTLLKQPISHRPGDPLGIVLDVSNAGTSAIEGFTLSVAWHARVETRSALHAAFEGSTGLVGGATSISFDDRVIEGGQRDMIHLDLTTDDLPRLSDQTEGGVYPLTLTFGVNGVPVDELTTPLIYYPERPETPLRLLLVVPLNDIPSRSPDGSFLADESGQSPLESATAPGGWLAELVSNMVDTSGELPPTTKTVVRKTNRPRRRRIERTIEIPTPSVHLGLAPTPRLLDELADISNGYRRETPDGNETVRSGDETAESARALLSDLSALAKESGIQPIAVPYSFPDIPTLARSLSADRLSLELSEGAEVLDGALGIETDESWLFAPAGRLDGESLSALQRSSSVQHALFSVDALADTPEALEEGCPEAFATFSCAITVRTTEGPADGFVGDPGLQERLSDLSRGADDALDLQKFFAETAAIRQEIPSVPDRVVEATIPSLWHPSAELSRDLLEGLRTAEWLKTVTPSEALSLADLQKRPRALVSQIPPLDQEPAFDYFNAIEDAAEGVAHFELVGPPKPIVQRMLRNTLVAQSRMWWSDSVLLERGRSYATETLEELNDELDKISLGTPAEIRLTSRQGKIPLVVFNETQYPVVVDIRMVSQQLDLELDPPLLEDQPIEPQSTNQFTVKARARSSGIFPLEIRLETPDGYQISSLVVTVSSTEFNEVALGITIGAFTFLVLFYVTRAIRRRMRARAST